MRRVLFVCRLRAPVICLDIPDDYGFMDPDRVRLLNARGPRHLGR